MWALQQQLKQRGALDETWQPPSLDVQMPAPEATPQAGAEIPAEPIEDPAVLAARKRLDELTPMKVAHHTLPVIEDVQADSADGEVVAAEASAERSTLVDPLAVPATKTRKRRTPATADQSTSAVGETPADGAPVAKTRKRRTPAASSKHTDEAERTNETESVTTEKAS
jgi:hypothetical protein